MNAVLEKSSTPNTFEQITEQLATLAQASAGCHHVLSQNPTLRAFASERLHVRLEALKAALGLIVINPDAIFLNHLSETGALSSLSMTDALIDAVRHGTTWLQSRPVACYTRHDSVEASHAFAPEQDRQMKALIRELSVDLIPRYREQVSSLWQKQLALPDQPERLASATELLIEQHRLALQSEIVLHGLSRSISASEQSRLSAAFDHGVPQGVYNLSWRSDTGVQIALPSVYAVAQTIPSGQPLEGVVFLVMPGRGVERFDSLAALREALSERLAGEHADKCLFDALLLSDQARAPAERSFSPQGWTLESISDSLLVNHLQGLQHKQTQDLAFLQSQSQMAVTEFHVGHDRTCICGHLDDAMGERFVKLAAQMDVVCHPHWRKYAPEHDKALLTELERQHAQRTQKVRALLKGLESLERFTQDQMTAHLQDHLGCLIDPAQVQVSLNEAINLGSQISLDANYAKSLLAHAVAGLPSLDGDVSVSPASEHLHAEFSSEFVKGMVDELNVPKRYAAALRTLYGDQENLRVLAQHRDSAIALGVESARMQGHLREARSLDMVHLVRCDKRKEGADYRMGNLVLLDTQTRFKDFIVFEEKTESDEHFVLYAPGAPEGQDFYEFGSWRQLCFQVGGWLATESGRAYLHDQLAAPTETGLNAILSNIQLKPSSFGPESCLFARCTGENFESNLCDLVQKRAFLSVRVAEMAAPASDVHKTYANRSILALVEARIEAFNRELSRLSPDLMSFRDFVHAHTDKVLNQFLRSQGEHRLVDPDTLYFGLGLPYMDSPDFSANGPLRSLTDLMMFGAEDILSYKPQIHVYSSTGMDVSRLPVGLIQFVDNQIGTADLGARYMDFLTQRFLSRKSPNNAQRRALMAARLQHEMISGALRHFLKGDLSERQYSWIRQAINGLNADTPEAVLSKTTGVLPFRIKGWTIEGVYVLKDFGTADPRYTLLYTPQAPDGIHFRPLADYGDLLTTVEMQNYCYGRVAYKGQRVIGTFLDELNRGKRQDPDFVRIRHDMLDRISDARTLYDEMVKRMIADVDAQTDSTAEKRLSMAWTIIRWTGTLLLMPFPTASIAWGVLTSSVSVIRGINAYNVGDRATALPLLIFGVMGFISGADAVRAFVGGSQTVLKSVGFNGGLWAWRKLELSQSFRVVA